MLEQGIRNPEYGADKFGFMDLQVKPRETWSDKEAFDDAARKLVEMFQDNFAKFESVVQADVMAIAMSA